MSVNEMLKNWKLMSLIREFDLYVKEFAKTADSVGYLHTSIGQEASSVAIIKQLHDGDWMTSTYRNHSHGVARGLDLYKMVAELLGRQTGYCKGLGGSMHIADQDINFIGSMGIVAGGIPIATGAAWGSKMLGKDQVALCFFGEGAIHQGAFHEGLEFAIKFEAPVLFVCENNLYAESTSSKYHLLHESTIGYVEPFDIKAIKVDGNDFEAVEAAAKECFDWIRTKKRPAFIESMTYKLSGQYEGDAETYKSVEEVAYWKSRDPLLSYKAKILEIDPTVESQFSTYESENHDLVVEAFERASKDPFPTIEEMYQAVYLEEEAQV
jgi:acetoin:2,6-dichlorophenolindophenol oxidoreductase subunit alpha